MQPTWRYEFHAVYDPPRQIDCLNPLIDAFAYRYNPVSSHPSVYAIEVKKFC
jgi:hypothetical protein